MVWFNFDCVGGVLVFSVLVFDLGVCYGVYRFECWWWVWDWIRQEFGCC